MESMKYKFLGVIVLFALLNVRTRADCNRSEKSIMYEECVFDTLYPVFRGVAGVYRFMPKIGWAILEGRTWSQKALRVLGAGGGAPMFPYVPNYERNGGLAALNEGRFAHNTEYVDDYKYDVRGRLRALKGYADSLRRCGTFNVEAESARLAARLSAFRDTAKVLPPIFATIMTEFDGDIRRYTDHLFGHSAVTSRRAFRKLLRRPTMRRMARDPGFQFVVSKLVYQTWEQQGRPMPSGELGNQPFILTTMGR